MRAISIWQPWASLIAAGLKEHETRSWMTTYRGPLAIHASKYRVSIAGWENLAAQLCELLKVRNFSELPHGAFVAVAELADAIPTEKLPDVAGLELTVGDFTAGRFAWRLARSHRLVAPYPYRGYQGLWPLGAVLTAELIGRLEPSIETSTQ